MHAVASYRRVCWGFGAGSAKRETSSQCLSSKFIVLRMGRDSWHMVIGQEISLVFCESGIYGKSVSQLSSLLRAHVWYSPLHILQICFRLNSFTESCWGYISPLTLFPASCQILAKVGLYKWEFWSLRA